MLAEILKLLGAGLLGGIGAKLLDIALQNKKEKNELSYLSIMLAAQLEEFIIGCSYVALDDGKYRGQIDSAEGYVPQTTAPKLNIDKLDVNWRLVKSMILHRIWQLPIKLKRIEERLADDLDWADGSGFEYIQLRRFYYSDIGLEAHKVFGDVLKLGGLSKVNPSDEYNYALDTLHSHYKQFKPKHWD